jgi:FRG domain
MLEQIDFANWAELEQHVQALANAESQHAASGVGHVSHLLYRGHASDGWQLETTLERASPSLTRLAEFYHLVAIAKPQVETFTGRSWTEIDVPAVTKALTEYDIMAFAPLPAYDYLVYVRHHGFPSSLLDWSRSLYVAAYFAYESPKAERVAIFVYQEHAGSGKLGSSSWPQIRVLGPYVRSHPRHFLQQGEYTMAVQFTEDQWCIAKHTNVFERTRENQDRLWKFTAPAIEAPEVMRRLDEYNINAFSLFQTEDALLRTVAQRALRLPRR